MARVPGKIPLIVGAGAGHTIGVRGNPTDELTLYAATGLEIEDRAGWAVRPELRLRAVKPWAGTIADFTLGVLRRLGA